VPAPGGGRGGDTPTTWTSRAATSLLRGVSMPDTAALSDSITPTGSDERARSALPSPELSKRRLGEKAIELCAGERGAAQRHDASVQRRPRTSSRLVRHDDAGT
jgi:hypothetical protein